MTQEPKKLPVTEVVLTVHVTGANDRPLEAGFSQQHHVLVQEKDFEMEIRHGDEHKPTERKYGDWAGAAYQACIEAARADLDTFEIRFVMKGGEEHWVTAEIPPDFSKGGRIGGVPMHQVEYRFERRGFECFRSGKGMWVVHRPDPRDAYAKRGYFDAAQTIRLASSDVELVDEVIKNYWTSHVSTSQYARYLTLRGERRGMAKDKKDVAEEAARKQTMVKALDGTEVGISPKQEEMLGQIKERSASGSPVGSDDERLDDPSSIAAMKLATGEHPVVVRAKFGTRWHYFAKQTDADKAVAAAEKAAADEKASKAASKKPAKADSEESTGSTKGTKPSAGSGGKLKKPSEK